MSKAGALFVLLGGLFVLSLANVGVPVGASGAPKDSPTCAPCPGEGHPGGLGRVETDADLAALAHCTTIGGNLGFYYVGAFTSRDLPCLTSVAGTVSISSNAVSLNALSSLKSVGGDLYIRDNASLTSLDGLSSLKWVGGFLVIQNNASLTSLDGLSSLKRVYRKLIINSNACISQTEAKAFAATIDAEGVSVGSRLLNLNGANYPCD